MGDMWVCVVWACIVIFVWLRGKIRVGEWCCEVVGSCEVQQVADFLLPRNLITCMCASVCLPVSVFLSNFWIPRVGPGHPSFPPLSIYFLIFSPFYFSLSFIGFTYFLLLSIPSLSTRIVPLCFQAGGRRRRPNLGLVYFVCVICIP